jgi:alkanesulfonate monooxygenase SsuD/methylene tetrahydromethanopterin reductase-like flavin-dependent oxidoreductase (luciferase family)
MISEIDIKDMKPESLDAAYERKAINEGWEFTPAFKENVKQPPPVANSLVPVWSLVMADMVARNAEGIAKYGVPLQPFNGRNTLLDAYEEALDLAVYLRTALYEKDGA